MGNYTTETIVMNLMPQLPRTTSAQYSNSSLLIAQAISDAESEIDGYIARRYSLPFAASSVPVQVRAIADRLAIFYTYLNIYFADNMNQNDYTSDARYKILLNQLENIAEGKTVLTLTNGSMIVQASSTSLVTSSQKEFTPIFDVDTSTSWRVDSDRLENISDDRN